MSFREDLLVFLALLLAGCTASPGSSASPFFPGGVVGGQSDENGDQISYWDDRPSAGKSRIVIDLSEQRASPADGNGRPVLSELCGWDSNSNSTVSSTG
jgi:hypothetical protein